MENQELTIIDIKEITDKISSPVNLRLAQVNDHVIRVSVMTTPYFWHLHPNSDETFLVLEGSVFIDLEDKTIELFPSQLFTIPKNVKHRTRPNGDRSINLTFESENLTTIKVEAPHLPAPRRSAFIKTNNDKDND
jgi:mannose-6-phosphate isomerase-like protein (cupin superfamily)